jgi:hypothetical protein
MCVFLLLPMNASSASPVSEIALEKESTEIESTQEDTIYVI